MPYVLDFTHDLYAVTVLAFGADGSQWKAAQAFVAEHTNEYASSVTNDPTIDNNITPAALALFCQDMTSATFKSCPHPGGSLIRLVDSCGMGDSIHDEAIGRLRAHLTVPGAATAAGIVWVAADEPIHIGAE